MNFRRYSKILILIISGLFILSSDKVEAEWLFEVVDMGVYDLIQIHDRKTSLAIDSNNNPHISYWDKTEDTLKYAYYDGSWQVGVVDTVTIDCSGLGGECPGQISLALDSNNNPHIIYYERFYDNGWHTKLKYAYYDGTWHIETVDDVSVWSYNSLALDSDNTPHISYNNNSSELKYAYYDGSWHKETVDLSTWREATKSSLLLDSAENPHIVYNVQYEYHGELKYAYNDGSWTIEPFHNYYAWIDNIASTFDSNEELHICYNEGDGGFGPNGPWSYSGQEYIHYDGVWYYEHLYGTTDGAYLEASIAQDNSDNIHIIYNDYLFPSENTIYCI